MTGYRAEDLEGWEFKIVRSTLERFSNYEAEQKLCQEEAQSGWEMIEKYDNGRIRFKRRIEESKRSTEAVQESRPEHRAEGGGARPDPSRRDAAMGERGEGPPSRFGGMSPEHAEATRQRFENMSPEEREAMRRQFENMSPEQREAMRKRFRNMSPDERDAPRQQRGGARDSGTPGEGR